MAKKSRSQIWTEYLLARSAIGFFSLLPRRLAVKIGVMTGAAGYLALPHLRRIGMHNLELAYPEMSLNERRTVLRNVFRNLGRMLGVMGQMVNIPPADIGKLMDWKLDPKFLTAFEKAGKEGRGRVILSGHMGNWELNAFSWAVVFSPLSYLARRMDNPKIEEMFLRIRSRFGNEQIEKTNSTIPIMRVLRRGGVVGIMADVNSHPKEGVFVPFFGIQACTAGGVAMLAMRSNSVIAPILSVWDESRGKYMAISEDIIEPQNTGDRKRDIEATTADYTAALERMIRRYPDQWMWIHKRWSTRPPGEKDLYE